MPDERFRRRRLPMKAEALVERATQFVDDAEQARHSEMDARLQRYAKYRQWTEGSSGRPWPNSSDVALPDLATNSLHQQDQLHNAVVGLRPVMNAEAVSEGMAEAAPAVDEIIDYQLFVENDEAWLRSLIEAYVNDGHFTALISWVREIVPVVENRRVAAPQGGVPLLVHFSQVLALQFPDARLTVTNTRGDFEIVEAGVEKPISAKFYRQPDTLDFEMVIRREARVFDGPHVQALDRSDVLHPPGVENLQPPSPHNPNGSPYVVYRDRPTLAEIIRLVRSGRYDMSEEALRALSGATSTAEPGAEAAQRQAIQGESGTPPTVEVPVHRRLERYMVFDTMPETEHGTPTEVVYWMLKDQDGGTPDSLLRFRLLTEVFPASPPRRPFAEAQYLHVKGTRTGIGQLELGEGLHDARKEIMDQAVDHGTFSLSPSFFYRPTSATKSEVIKMYPGDGYPLLNPRDDIRFMEIPQGPQAAALNWFSIMGQEEEKVTSVGDLDLGRVPRGKASALRTLGGMQAVMQRGATRPEGALRRFFGGLEQIWSMVHELNRRMLPAEKQFRISLPNSQAETPYRTLERTSIDGDFQFTFRANALNTSRVAKQEALQNIAAMTLTPLAVQSGITTPTTIYRQAREWVEVWGQKPDEFLVNPMGADMVTSEEAIADIMDGRLPQGLPMEGAQMHLVKLQQFTQTEQIGLLNGEQIEMLKQWMQFVQGLLQQQQALAEASANAGPAGLTDGGGGGTQAPDTSEAPLETNELRDESLPTAGGGAR